MQARIGEYIVDVEIVRKNNTSFNKRKVDFYIPECKLVIEIDGVQHKEISERIANVGYANTIVLDDLKILLLLQNILIYHLLYNHYLKI